MPYGKYVRKNGEIEAFQFINTQDELDQLVNFGVTNFTVVTKPYADGKIYSKLSALNCGRCVLSINEGDYIIKESDGYHVRFYGIPKDTFEQTFVKA